MTAPTMTSPGPDSRSRAVTVVAWLALAISALEMLGALGSALVLALAPPAEIARVLSTVTRDTAVVRVMPRALWFELHHPVLVRSVQFVLWTVAVIASFGLLRRRDWARRLFIGLLGLAIVSVVFGFYTGQSMVLSLFSRPGRAGGQTPEGVGSGLALGWLMILAVVGVLVWLVVWFRSARVRAEFAAGDGAA